ncbi:MAG: nitroreductase family protein [Clostridiales bacterium]|nr:nitroreductase family protein [Clostridiales bacterium]
MIKELIIKNRSYRRFYQDVEISTEVLEHLVDLARLSASGANMQPLKYYLSNKPESNEVVFKHLKWAAYLKEWDGPEEGEKPSAYIVVLCDQNIRKNVSCDHGIVSQSILLGACEKEYGGCIFGSINREGLRSDLNIPERYDILLVIALGKPKEKVVLDEIEADGDIKYWRDDKGIHHVPKRKLKDIILDSIS